MKKRRLLTFSVALLILLFFLGCAALETSTMENPTGSIDPNSVNRALETTINIGQAISAIGTAIANPSVVGVGIVLASIGGTLLASRKEKKNGQ